MSAMLVPKTKDRWDDDEQRNVDVVEDVLQFLIWDDDMKKALPVIVNTPESLEILREGTKLVS